MTSRRYQKTLNRQQELLLPMRVEEFVSETNSVRAIDAYVNALDIQSLGVKYAQGVTQAGQPPYNPQAMLKLSNTAISKAFVAVASWKARPTVIWK